MHQHKGGRAWTYWQAHSFRRISYVSARMSIYTLVIYSGFLYFSIRPAPYNHTLEMSGARTSIRMSLRSTRGRKDNLQAKTLTLSSTGINTTLSVHHARFIAQHLSRPPNRHALVTHPLPLSYGRNSRKGHKLKRQ